MRKQLSLAILAGLAWVNLASAADGDRIKVILIDGQNNHNWRATTPQLKKALEQTGRFTVDVATAPERPRQPQKPKDANDEAAQKKYQDELAQFEQAIKAHPAKMAEFRPDLSRYDVVLSNYNGEPWPADVNQQLENLLREGKVGLVIVHAANNSFGGWKEYQKMVGMGWYGPAAGGRLYLDDAGKEVRLPTGQGDGPGHRYTGEFQVTIRDREHPVTRGMPPEWLHARDELYDNMHGPMENIHLLATAYSKGTKVHEPMIWTIDYGKGRVFHTPMGHDLNAMKCIGFISTLQRGTEWAATGKVTLPLPGNFPTPDKASSEPADQ